MKYIVDNDMHIHSFLSSCSSDPEQSPEAILEYAKKCGLKTICLTDHFWDHDAGVPSEWYAPQDFDHIRKSLPLPEDNDVRFLFGCEADLDKNRTLGITKEHMEAMDFVVISTTHFHMTGFTLKDEERASVESRAKAWVERLDAVFDMDLPFKKIGLAHLSCKLIAPERSELLEVLKAIPEEEMERVFKRVAELGVGIELNSSDMSFADAEADIILKPFRIAKKCGCKFYFGSDAHHPDNLYAAIPKFERAVEFLELEESDKFVI